MRNAHWLWVTDLSQPEHYAIRVLPIVMIVSSFLMQKMTPMTGGDPAQQKVMKFMPLMFGVMFYSASSGLVLYWLTSNIVNIAQQWFFNRTATEPDVGPPPKAKGKGKRGRVSFFSRLTSFLPFSPRESEVPCCPSQKNGRSWQERRQQCSRVEQAAFIIEYHQARNRAARLSRLRAAQEDWLRFTSRPRRSRCPS